MLFKLLLLSTFSFFVTDVYLPALPYLTKYFGVEENALQLSLTVYLLGVAFSQIFYGVFSDKYGRKPAMYLGLSINIVGTLMVIFAPSIYIMNIGRLIQGIGLGCTVSVPRALMTDIYQGKDLAMFSSYIAMSVPLVISTAPLVGGYILEYADWRGIFIFILLETIFLLLMLKFFIEETHKSTNANAMDFSHMLANSKHLFKNGSYLASILCTSATMYAIFSYVTSSSFLVQNLAGASAIEYSWYMGLNGVVIFLGAVINNRMLRHFCIPTMIIIGATSILTGSAILLYFSTFEKLTAPMIVFPSLLAIVAATLTFANSMAIALQGVDNKTRGLAVSFFGFLQTMGGVMGGTVLSLINENSVRPLSYNYLTAGIVSLCSAIYLYRNFNRPPNHKQKPEETKISTELHE